MHPPLPTLKTSAFPPLARLHSTPSPASSHSSSSSSSILDSPRIDSLIIRRKSEPPTDIDRRESAGSMTSWDSLAEGVFKPPDTQSSPTSAPLIAIPSNTTLQLGTPEADHLDQFNTFSFSNGNTSPASSVTSTAHSKGEATPRAEIAQPLWPLSVPTPTKLRDHLNYEPEAGDMNVDEPITGSISSTSSWQQPALRNDASWRRKHGSLDMPHAPDLSAPQDIQYRQSNSKPAPSAFPANSAPQYEPSPSNSSNRRSSESARTSGSQQRVVAESTATGCCISAPLSPPAHYPGSARPAPRRNSGSHVSGDASETVSSSSGSSHSISSSFHKGLGSAAPTAPRWAHPPQYTNKISGRAWSFSQGQERPDVDFDPELFEGAEPESILEVMKGMEGRIAVKTTPTDYNIMAWLPGFSIDDITISMKGDRTVQIVADLWDEEDHAQWNVVLGEDVNKNAIGATFKGAELRVTVKRRLPPQARSIRSNYSSRSAPAKVAAPQINTIPSADKPQVAQATS